MRPLVIDLTRLIARSRHASPSGIDRVDLAYARHVLDAEGERFGLVWTPLGPRLLARGEACAIVRAVGDGWAEDVEADDDPVYRRVASGLGADSTVARPEHRPRARGGRWRQTDLMLAVLRARRGGAAPQGSIYINTSHMGLERPERFDWLYARRDVRAVFFVHDLIPVSHPEYGRAGEAARHAARLRTISRHAAHVVVNSADVGERLHAHLSGQGLATSPVTVAPLGVEPAFSRPGDPVSAPAAPAFAQPVFLVCGTIEARKNHLLLLQVWRELARRLGAATPRLLIVGRRGWEAQNAIDLLDRCEALRPHVVEASGLSTRGLAAVMRGATALLMPSFIEGYGLPIVEAAACGLPVVASDIPVHREVGDALARFLDPLDGPGWAAAVEALSGPSAPARAELAARLRGFAAPSWTAHFARVDAALGRLGERP